MSEFRGKKNIANRDTAVLSEDREGSQTTHDFVYVVLYILLCVLFSETHRHKKWFASVFVCLFVYATLMAPVGLVFIASSIAVTFMPSTYHIVFILCKPL